MNRSSGRRRQRGLTMVSWMFILAVGVFFALLAIKMVPTYLEYFSIKKILTKMEDDRSLRKMSVGELRTQFKRSLRINSVYNFDMKDFKVIRDGERNLVKVEYEVRKPVAGNVAVVMSFDSQITIPVR